MLTAISVRSYGAAEYNKKEICRYAGAALGNEDLELLIDECIGEINENALGRVCYREFDVAKKDGILDLGFVKTSSSDLAKNLDGCESIILFGATVGFDVDRLISKYSRVSPLKALVFEAIGAERVELLCDTFAREIAKEKHAIGKACRARFSPGYGDLPLEIQREIVSVLDCQRKIGLTLNSSLLMSPSKSVTAIIGVYPEKAR